MGSVECWSGAHSTAQHSTVQCCTTNMAALNTDKFSLRWNDFPDNVTAIFRQLRSESILSDVTLVCAGGTQVAAHKVVLSSSSSFFRQFFQDNSQDHPWLYMRGVHAELLSWLMDFIYLGEVQVTQASFSGFISLAQDLGVRGLAGLSHNVSQLIKRDERSQAREYLNRHTYADDYSEETGEGDGQGSQYGEESSLVKSEPVMEVDLPENYHLDMPDSPENQLVIVEDEIVDGLTKEEKVKLRVQQRLLNSERQHLHTAAELMTAERLTERGEVNAELDKRISEVIAKRDGVWSCTVCGKSANHKSKLKQHVETHLQGFSHPCLLCGKSYRSRNVLRMHMSRDHKNKGQFEAGLVARTQLEAKLATMVQPEARTHHEAGLVARNQTEAGIEDGIVARPQPAEDGVVAMEHLHTTH